MSQSRKSSHDPGPVEFRELCHRAVHQLVDRHVQGGDDVFLGLEVVVEGGLGDPDPLGDLPERGLVVALLHEEVQGDVEDALTVAWISPRPREGG